MAENQLKVLEQKIDELITLCNQLNRENQALKAESANWQRERKDLMDRNEVARNKVEAMISRLRTMEQTM
jgi:cell division protein ZapB